MKTKANRIPRANSPKPFQFQPKQSKAHFAIEDNRPSAVSQCKLRSIIQSGSTGGVVQMMRPWLRTYIDAHPTVLNGFSLNTDSEFQIYQANPLDLTYDRTVIEYINSRPEGQSPEWREVFTQRLSPWLKAYIDAHPTVLNGFSLNTDTEFQIYSTDPLDSNYDSCVIAHINSLAIDQRPGWKEICIQRLSPWIQTYITAHPNVLTSFSLNTPIGSQIYQTNNLSICDQYVIEHINSLSEARRPGWIEAKAAAQIAVPNPIAQPPLTANTTPKNAFIAGQIIPIPSMTCETILKPTGVEIIFSMPTILGLGPDTQIGFLQIVKSGRTSGKTMRRDHKYNEVQKLPVPANDNVKDSDHSWTIDRPGSDGNGNHPFYGVEPPSPATITGSDEEKRKKKVIGIPNTTSYKPNIQNEPAVMWDEPYFGGSGGWLPQFKTCAVIQYHPNPDLIGTVLATMTWGFTKQANQLASPVTWGGFTEFASIPPELFAAVHVWNQFHPTLEKAPIPKPLPLPPPPPPVTIPVPVPAPQNVGAIQPLIPPNAAGQPFALPNIGAGQPPASEPKEEKKAKFL